MKQQINWVSPENLTEFDAKMPWRIISKDGYRVYYLCVNRKTARAVKGYFPDSKIQKID